MTKHTFPAFWTTVVRAEGEEALDNQLAAMLERERPFDDVHIHTLMVNPGPIPCAILVFRRDDGVYPEDL